MSTISINLVVLNGEKYIRHCFDALLKQSFDHSRIAVNILDNGSTDATKEIIKDFGFRISDLGFSRFDFIESKLNLGMWGGQEELLKNTQSEYVVFLSVDVIMDEHFVERAVEAMESDSTIGALQAKVYQFDIHNFELSKAVIDTCGFKIFRSRRVINIGHGQADTGQFGTRQEIFGVEGAVPVFRTKALESIRIMGEIADHDLFWYAEDLDVAWRLRLAGWKEIYDPAVVAWHDRQTTKRLRGGFADFRAIRKAIPLRKRQLEWRNIRFTIIKNDYIINILKDLIFIIPRELAMTAYLIIFEPGVFAELPAFLKLLPKMLRKRRAILSRAVITPDYIRSYFS